MAQSTIIFYFKWKSEQTDCRKCYICEDIIVSDMWRIIIVQRNVPKINITQSDDPKAFDVAIDINQRETQTGVVICSSCYEIIEKT